MPDAAAIAALFLGQVEVAIAAVEPEHPLPPREAAALGRAVAVRRREFAAGRTCARRALAALGRPVDDLLRDADGLPAWPDGVVGGITHTRDVAAAVVGSAQTWRGLALDVETRAGLESHLWEKTLTPAERAALPADGAERAALALFCAKEALYKCWYPLRRVFLGFHDVELVRDADTVRLVAFTKGPPPPISLRLLDDPTALLATASWPTSQEVSDT